MWNKWKNDGCPSFALKPLAKEEAEQERNKWEELAKNRKRKARLGDMVNYIYLQQKKYLLLQYCMSFTSIFDKTLVILSAIFGT
jgi:hypothetical protein